MEKAEKVFIATPFIRLDQFIKWAGLTDTGGRAKEIIAEGSVTVNGEKCTLRGRKIFPGDIVNVEGCILEVCVGEN